MDNVLIDYIRSGKAWILVGSGPSTEMGYPTWSELSQLTIQSIKRDRTGADVNQLATAHEHGDFPRVFQLASDLVGKSSLLEILRPTLKPKSHSAIYPVLARWPVSVYLTTNYDDEITNQLAQIKESYVQYTNSADHLSLLTPDLKGAVVKLHGDLRSEAGLVLTSGDYEKVVSDDSWEHWRSKMTSVFQMIPIVIIGHSLNDPNIRHILAAARKGAGVHRPVCWIAPDVSINQANEFLEKFRIRVVSYDNRDGSHKNLVRLVKLIDEFIQPRASIPISEQIARISTSPLRNYGAAPGFFVYNQLARVAPIEEKRVNVIIAAVQAAIPQLKQLPSFDLQTALGFAGWPKEVVLPSETVEQVMKVLIENEIISKDGASFRLAASAEQKAAESKSSFEHLRQRFIISLKSRIRRDYPQVKLEASEGIANDIEGSLTGYFREGGLSLATILFSSDGTQARGGIPSSILRFITEASARYSDPLFRQVFVTVSVDSFSKAESPEREFLGRVAQGYFAFHALGVFGDVAMERLRHAKDTIWLIDSNAQIPALALSASMHSIFSDTFERLREKGVRLFSTLTLFHETFEHLWWANRKIQESSGDIATIIAAATGQPPYRRSNQFLEGFIKWRTVASPNDWESYVFQVIGSRRISEQDVQKALEKKGIEVVDFSAWPGFNKLDYADREQYVEKIAAMYERETTFLSGKDESLIPLPLKKAQPEAEAFIIVKKEREGRYHILSETDAKSPAWFVSRTSVLNIIEPRMMRITWQPDAFLQFATTLAPPVEAGAHDKVFESLLWGFAQSGTPLLDDATIEKGFKAVVDQTALNISEQREIYEKLLHDKYGEPIENVLGRIPASGKPIAAVQLKEEMLAALHERLSLSEKSREDATSRVSQLEKDLKDVDHFRRKMDEKRMRNRPKAQRKKKKR